MYGFTVDLFGELQLNRLGFHWLQLENYSFTPPWIELCERS